jgi:hypothetical protein
MKIIQPGVAARRLRRENHPTKASTLKEISAKVL